LSPHTIARARPSKRSWPPRSTATASARNHSPTFCRRAAPVRSRNIGSAGVAQAERVGELFQQRHGTMVVVVLDIDP
jgi:hypothetical protein